MFKKRKRHKNRWRGTPLNFSSSSRKKKIVYGLTKTECDKLCASIPIGGIRIKILKTN